MIALLRKVADPGDGEGRLGPGCASMMYDRHHGELSASSKLIAEWDFFAFCATRGDRRRRRFSTITGRIWESARRSISTFCSRECERMGLVGILIALGLLIWLAYRGWSILLLAPAAAILAAGLAGEPLLAHWTQTFMASAAQFVMQFFPIFLLGALFGKLMEDSGSVTSIAKYMTERLGPQRSVLAVVLAGAIVTYGGVSLFVAFFVIAPMAHQLFRAAAIPRRLMPAAIALGTTTFTMSALPGTPAIQNAIPMPFFGTTPFAAPGLGFIAAIVMFGFGMWWLGRAERSARAKGEGYGRRFHTRTRPRIFWCASARPPPARSIRRKRCMDGRATWGRRSRSRPCRWSSSSRSISSCRSSSCRARTRPFLPTKNGARPRSPRSVASGRW